MPSLAKEIVSVIEESLKPATPASGIDYSHVRKVLAQTMRYFNKMDTGDKERTLKQIRRNAMGHSPENRNMLLSFLYYVTHDENLLTPITQNLKKFKYDLRQLNYMIWQVLSVLFTHQGEIADETIRSLREDMIRPLYLEALEQNQLRVNPRSMLNESRPIQKVAIICAPFLHVQHSPSRNAMLIASGLMKHCGLQTKIINTRTIPYTESYPFFKNVGNNINPFFKGEQSFECFETEFGKPYVDFYTPELNEVTPEALEHLHNYLIEQEFDAIINIGDNLFISERCFGEIPILTIATGRQIPLGSADYLILIQDQLDAFEKEILSRLPLKGYDLDWKLNASIGTEGEAVSRKNLGLPEDRFVYAVVGNRLGAEIESGDFLNICQELTQEGNAWVLFIGNHVEVERTLKQKGLLEHPNFYWMESTTNLRGTYKACDAYLNPFRSGGGVSAQMAMLEGLPVITLDGCDVATCIEPSLRAPNIETYRKIASDIQVDAQSYAQHQAASQKASEALISNAPHIERIHGILNSLKPSMRPTRSIDELSQVQPRPTQAQGYVFDASRR